MQINQITGKVIQCGIEVHRQLGPGLLESSYLACLSYELVKAGLSIEQQVPLPLVYKEVFLETGYRLDLMVERKVVVEVKSVDHLNDLHVAQVLTYLQLTHCDIGLLINFNVVQLRDGIRRLIARHSQLSKSNS